MTPSLATPKRSAQLAAFVAADSPSIRLIAYTARTANRWATATLIEPSGRRWSVDLVASSVFDAAHLFVTHAQENLRNGLPRPTTESGVSALQLQRHPGCYYRIAWYLS